MKLERLTLHFHICKYYINIYYFVENGVIVKCVSVLMFIKIFIRLYFIFTKTLSLQCHDPNTTSDIRELKKLIFALKVLQNMGSCSFLMSRLGLIRRFQTH